METRGFGPRPHIISSSSVQFGHSVVSDSLRPHGLQDVRLPCPSPTPGAYSKLMSIESMMPYNHLILCHPLLFPPSIFPSIRVFSKEPVLHIRWPKHWSFSFSISPSNGWAGWITLQSKRLSRVFKSSSRENHYE